MRQQNVRQENSDKLLISSRELGVKFHDRITTYSYPHKAFSLSEKSPNSQGGEGWRHRGNKVGGGGGLVSSKDLPMPNLKAKKECGKVNKMIMDTEFNWAFTVESSECLFKLMSPTACNTPFVIRKLLIVSCYLELVVYLTG